MYSSIRPGKFWYDTDGKRIQAHGGSIIFINDTFYWYGENKDGITGTSTVFRIENVEGNCATFRVLVPTTTETGTTYAFSNSFFTIDLSCVLAIQCLADTFAN